MDSETGRKRADRASAIPFGLGRTKPHNHRDVLRAAWENKRQRLFTWRILRDGMCYVPLSEAVRAASGRGSAEILRKAAVAGVPAVMSYP